MRLCATWRLRLRSAAHCGTWARWHRDWCGRSDWFTQLLPERHSVLLLAPRLLFSALSFRHPCTCFLETRRKRRPLYGIVAEVGLRTLKTEQNINTLYQRLWVCNRQWQHFVGDYIMKVKLGVWGRKHCFHWKQCFQRLPASVKCSDADNTTFPRPRPRPRQQESRAVASKPRDAAAVLFGWKFADNILYRFKSSQASKSRLQSSEHTGAKRNLTQNGHSRSFKVTWFGVSGETFFIQIFVVGCERCMRFET